MRPLYAVLIFVCLFFACCFAPRYLMEEPPPTMATVPGSYRGEYQGGVETFEVRSDLKYTQEFRQNGVLKYRNEGTWFIGGKDVVFTHFVRAIGNELYGPSGGKVSEISAMWVDFGGGYSIIFDIDHHHSISRMKTAAEKAAK